MITQEPFFHLLVDLGFEHGEVFGGQPLHVDFRQEDGPGMARTEGKQRRIMHPVIGVEEEDRLQRRSGLDSDTESAIIEIGQGPVGPVEGPLRKNKYGKVTGQHGFQFPNAARPAGVSRPVHQHDSPAINITEDGKFRHFSLAQDAKGVAANSLQDDRDIQVRDMIGDKDILPAGIRYGLEKIGMADADERKPGTVPITASLIDPVTPSFFILQREEDDERQHAEHAGDEQQEGIDAIKPPNGFD